MINRHTLCGLASVYVIIISYINSYASLGATWPLTGPRFAAEVVVKFSRQHRGLDKLMNATLTLVEGSKVDLNDMMENAEEACEFIKAISTPTRLMLLCHLIEGERTVSDLADCVGAKQSLTSHHLNRLKQAGLVQTRRDEKFIYYSIKNPIAEKVVGVLHEEFCAK